MGNEDDAYDFSAYDFVCKLDGHIYMEHEVKDIYLRVREPQFIDEMSDIKGTNDVGDKGFYVSEDDKLLVLHMGFKLIHPQLDLTQFLLFDKLVVPKTNLKMMINDDLGSSYSYESDDDKCKGPKF